MHEYLLPLHMIYAFSPLITVLFLIPCILFQRRKYGKIVPFRMVMMYLFLLYLIGAYFYIITPLPSFEYVLENPLPLRIQLHPLAFAYDFKEQAYWVLAGIGEVNISHSAWFQVMGNIILLFPFGFYLNYYFRRALPQTALFSFLLSLFFELTQLTALYGFYPAPYRIFDINDLMFNTLGGVLGYYATPYIKRLLHLPHIS
ncbi:MAG: VanZ family protein [Lachnospiraceae bacterium]|nr:VanZ family protein [Lachnospiraceae bacterium]